jgi:hypothetical protein
MCGLSERRIKKNIKISARTITFTACKLYFSTEKSTKNNRCYSLLVAEKNYDQRNRNETVTETETLHHLLDSARSLIRLTAST